MANLAPLSSLQTAVSLVQGAIALVTPVGSTQGYQPLNKPNSNGTASQAPQSPALIFNYEGENVVALESDITDHWIENNSTIQDQIALKPEQVTVHGFIGELNDVLPPSLASLQAVANKLTIISGYAPSLSATALLAYDKALLAYEVAASVANSAVSAWSSLTNTGPSQNIITGQAITTSALQNKQQQMFSLFYFYWRSQTLFNVQTPWAVFNNMAISRMRAIQDAETNVITDYEITFKMMRFASTLSINIAPILQGRLNDQASPGSSNGISSGTPSSSSFSSNVGKTVGQ